MARIDSLRHARTAIAVSGLTLAFATSAAAQEPAHPEIPDLATLLAAVAAGDLSIDDLRRLGLSIFTTPFNVDDGYGDGPFAEHEANPLVPGQRPTLQGNGLSLRVNGLDAQSCNECHTLVSNRDRPPRLGIGGAGSLVTNAVIRPSVIDNGDSTDPRVAWGPGHDPDLPMAFDGVADFNGRYANPPFLFGGGGVELLAKEMTADLQQLLATARQSAPGTVVDLDTHGTHFGTVTTIDAGQVELDLEGIGGLDFEELSPEAALVVKPFGRKGDNFSMRDFDRGAMIFHFGIEPVERVGAGNDADGDGLADEITVAEMSVLHVFDVTNPPPVAAPLKGELQLGFDTFVAVGCADCHHPIKITRSSRLPLAHPEVATDPSANVYLEIDLARFGFRRQPEGGIAVPLFADLKRHDMGPALAESLEGAGSRNAEFTTARLWGVADTAPYLHDGRATTLFDAIDMHGGEAQPSRDQFVALPPRDRAALLAFLGSLRTPQRPNEDLLAPKKPHP